MTLKKALRLSFCLALLLVIGCGDSPFVNKKVSTARYSDKTKPSTEEVWRFEKAQLNVNLYWRSGPIIGAESKLLVVITDNQGTPVSPEANLHLYLWMPKMTPPHGTFPFTIKEIAPGVFEITKMYFTMAGYWDLHIQLTSDSQVLEEIKWPIEL